MRKSALLGVMSAAITVVGGLSAQSAGAATLSYKGGPVMSSARWVEVVWGEGFATENASLPGYVASYLTDDAADSGKTTNVFAIDAQYSTVGQAKGSSQVLAYDQSFAGSTQIAPSKCGSPSNCSLTESDIETELSSQIAAGHIPAPTGDGMTTAYVVLFPESIKITDSNSSQSGVSWCSEHGSKILSGSGHMIFSMIPDLGNSGGCGALPNRNDNVILSLSHQQNEMLTDPLVVQNELGWYDENQNDTPGYGEIGDICANAGIDYGEETIGSHKWHVQNEWSNVDNKCEATTTEFSAPSADFTATPTANTAAFAATGESANRLGSALVPGIAGYSWDFGDGQSGSGTTPSHAYAAAGTYTVTLTATDTLGFTAHATHQVTVSAPPSTGGSGAGGSSGGSGSTGNGGSSGNGNTGGSGNAGGNGGGTGGTATVSSTGAPSTTGKGSSVVVLSGETAQCPPAGGLCVVTVTGEVESAHLSKKHSKNRKVQVGKATITLAPGTSTKLSFQLNGTGKKLLRAQGHLLVKVIVTIRHGSDAAVVSTQTIKITAPKKKHGH